MAMKSFPDGQLKFGKVSAAGTFGNVIHLGGSDAARMSVFIAGGNGGTFTLKAGTDGSTFGTTLGSVTIGDKGEGNIVIPEGVEKTPYLQLSCTGSLTADATAYIDTYLGI
jgi:hypothetical protein